MIVTRKRKSKFPPECRSLFSVGGTLADWLVKLELDLDKASKISGLSTEQLQQLLNNEIAVTTDIAEGLSKIRFTVGLWRSLDNYYGYRMEKKNNERNE
jgi:plasmid maintenance system antidote protein VapI